MKQASPGAPSALADRKALLFALFVLVALALRATTFGDTNRHADETFYFLVGQRMHEGLLPYVDVWDRKPLGLFLIYWLIAGVSHSVLAYQLVACAMAGATALVIARLVAHWGNARGGLFAGLAYLFAIGPFEGITGQAPDFYNLLIASAALLLSHDRERLLTGQAGGRTWGAMALCGLALTIKQTTLFESAWFGLFALFCLHRGGAPLGRIAGFATRACALGALPTLAIAAFYWQAGHWAEFWHAMVTSNLNKLPEGGAGWRVLGIGLRAIMVLLPAAAGLALGGERPGARLFVGGWVAAAFAGFAAVPNAYAHYLLPVMVPLSVAAGLFLSRVRFRFVIVLVIALYALMWDKPDRRAWTRGSIESMAEMARVIRAHDGGGGLLVYEGPHYLYALAGKRFLSPLVFPHHFNHAIENNVSHLDTRAEIDRVLSRWPGVIVMTRHPRSLPVNAYVRGRVLAYARAHCASRQVVTLREDHNLIPVVIFGDCGPGQRAGIPAGQ